MSHAYLLVASSIMRRLLDLHIARARQKSCCWPWERSSSDQSASNPPLDSTWDQRLTTRRDSIILSSVAVPSGLALRRIVPWRKKGCWGMVLILDRTCAFETLEMSTPSMNIEPLLASRIRSKDESKDDLPLCSELVFFSFSALRSSYGGGNEGLQTCQSCHTRQFFHHGKL